MTPRGTTLAFLAASVVALTVPAFATSPDEAAPASVPASMPSSAPAPASAPATAPAGGTPGEGAPILRYARLPPPAPIEVHDLPGGRRLFRRYCTDCHGRKGNGKGPAASFMDPPPRDLTRGVFKIRSTETGELPTDWDLLESISRGMPGTAMIGWSGLSVTNRWRLVGYVKSLSTRFAEEAAESAPPLYIGAPPPENRAAIARGRAVYDEMKCWECHGRSGRGDGPAAKTHVDDLGRRIYPFDMTKSWKLKSGAAARDIVKAYFTGLDGTPMPSYVDSLRPDQAWDLAFYVRSLFTDR